MRQSSSKSSGVAGGPLLAFCVFVFTTCVARAWVEGFFVATPFLLSMKLQKCPYDMVQDSSLRKFTVASALGHCCPLVVHRVYGSGFLCVGANFACTKSIEVDCWGIIVLVLMLLVMQRMLTEIQMIVTITIVIIATRIVAILVTNNKKWCQQPQNRNLQPNNQ